MKTPESPSAGPASRLAFIDSLRGFALFGVYWANLLLFAGFVFMTEEQRSSLRETPLDAGAEFLQLFFIENKFLGLFSLLFGISFWLFLSRAHSRGGAAASLFYRRIGWLFVIGLIHGWLLWCFDILRFYALWGLLLPLFIRMKPRRLLGCALFAAVLAPALISGVRAWLPAAPEAGPDLDAMTFAAFAHGAYGEVLAANWKYDWYLTESIGQIAYQLAIFGRLLLGLYAARRLDLWNLEAHRLQLRKIWRVSALVGVAGSSVFALDLLQGNGVLLSFARRLIVESGHLGLTLAYASGLALLFQNARWSRAIGLLAPLGRMALTWYLFQTVLGIWLFYGFAHGPALMGRVTSGEIMMLCILGYVAQVVVAHVWMSRFRFGPAEWLWRTLTYWRAQPLKLTSRTQ